MSAKEHKGQAGASLSDLLAEHTRVAEQEKQELEDRLREREEQGRLRREQEEQRQKELLQKRLQEEKQRAEERFQRQQRKDAPVAAAAVQAVTEGSGLIDRSSLALHVPPTRKGHTLLAVFATFVVMAGGAAAAYFLLFADKSPQLDIMGRHAVAVLGEARREASSLWATHRATEESERQAAEVDRLGKELSTLRTSLAEVTTAKQQAEILAAQEAKKREQAEAEAKAAAEAATTPKGGKRRARGGEKRGDGGPKIKVRDDIFSGKGKFRE